MSPLAYAGGLVLGLANNVRHRLQGYTQPRPFGVDDVDRSVSYAIDVGRRWQRYVDVSGTSVLEIGPGPDLGAGAVLLADGAASYKAVDAFPLAARDLSRFYETLAKRIGPIDPSQLDYTLATFPDLPELAAKFDIVVSHATLEHIEHIPKLFRRLRELAPSGVMCHQVDPITHMRWVRERDPWNILRYGDLVYRLMAFPGAPNRLLADDYVDAARKAGFSEISVHPDHQASALYLQRLRSELPRRFAGRADLRLLGFTMVAS